jgi:HlyD family secretion protein
MDIERPDLKKKRKRRRAVVIAAAVVVLAAAGVLVARMKPASPEVDRSTIWTGTVARGTLLRQVRGIGSLVPREDKIQLIPAQTQATITRILVLPGAQVNPDTVLMQMTDPALEQQLLTAQLALQGAKADYRNTQASLDSGLMTQRAGEATAAADQSQAAKQAQTDEALYKLGVISGLTYSVSSSKAAVTSTQLDIAKQQVSVNKAAIVTQLQVQQTKVDQAKAMLGLLQRESDALQVHAGIAGVVVKLDHQVGENVAPGTTLAEVVQPNELKASLKIPETQARDILLGQPSEIDTHNGVIDGTVSRIDPAVVNGTVAVDVRLIGPLPLGARQDLSVDGTINLQTLKEVLYVGRPADGNENSTISLFKLSPDGKTATRVSVKVGLASVNSIEVLGGLNAGDTVILSDMSRWDGVDHIRLD